MISQFVSYGTSHLVVLAVFVAVAVALLSHGRRTRGRAVQATVCRIHAVVILAVQLPFQIFAMLPMN